MAICTECGKTVADGKKFCTSCGKPMKAAKTRARKTPVSEKQTAVAPKPKPSPKQKPAPVKKTAKTQNTVPAAAASVNTGNQLPQGNHYAVMSVGSFVLASILMSIPVIGLIICLVWAFGGCKNINKRNYARAFLIFMLIGLVLCLVGYLLAGWARETLLKFLLGSELDMFGEDMRSFGVGF